MDGCVGARFAVVAKAEIVGTFGRGAGAATVVPAVAVLVVVLAHVDERRVTRRMSVDCC